MGSMPLKFTGSENAPCLRGNRDVISFGSYSCFESFGLEWAGCITCLVLLEFCCHSRDLKGTGKVKEMLERKSEEKD